MANIEKELFGKLEDGREVDIYTLSNGDSKVRITNFGAAVVSLETPDREGEKTDIVLGYDNLQGYMDDTFYLGVIAGRYANRIAKGKFELDGKEYKLACNLGNNHLHGGNKGFNKVLWRAEPGEDDKPTLQLSYLSKDGEEGYPNNLNCRVTYSLTENNELVIDYFAETDKPTVVNFTNHSYFNLAGIGGGDILDHEVVIYADKYTELDSESIPTGEIKSVKGTPFDFTTPHKVGERIEQAGGYDLNYVLNEPGNMSTPCAKVYESESGRVMQVFCTQPGVQFYTGNFLDGSAKGKSAVYTKYSGLCLETQHFPDSPNHPDFPSTVLRPGQQYRHRTVFKFETE